MVRPHTMALLHPVPTAINGALVGVLAVIAGAEVVVALALVVAMLGYQASIGALNDIADVDVDRLRKPRKPLPAGVISVPAAYAVVALGAAVGLCISAALGIAVLVLGAAGYATGVAYDLVMRQRGLGWLCFAAAFPLLLAWTWVAAAGTLPPGSSSLLPLAALAGPTLHLANSLVDMDLDDGVQRRSLATWLGPFRARKTLAVLTAVILALAWATLATAGTTSVAATLAALVGSLAMALGVTFSWQQTRRSREAGWLLYAAGLAAMAAAWLASIA